MAKIIGTAIFPSCLWAVILLVLLVWLRPSSGLGHRNIRMHKTPQTDLIFTEDLLWATVRLSVLGCAVSCVSDSQCVSFTVTRTTRAGHKLCRGHSVEPTGPGVGSPGSRLYLLDDSRSALSDHDVTTTSEDVSTTTAAENGSSGSVSGVWPISPELGPTSTWLYKNCNSSDDCPDVGETDCFRNKCVCYPGHYFSEGADVCLENCAQNNLGSYFVLYPRKSIKVGNSFETLLPLSLISCQTYCFTFPNCRSVNYDSVKSQCSLISMDANDDHADFMYWKDELSYCQRTCE